jgi:acyl carrier protein
VTISPLSKPEIYARLKEVLVVEFGLREDQVRPGAHLVEDLDLDSIDWIDMAVALETKLGHKLKEHDLTAIRVVQDVVDLIDRKLRPDGT